MKSAGGGQQGLNNKQGASEQTRPSNVQWTGGSSLTTVHSTEQHNGIILMFSVIAHSPLAKHKDADKWNKQFGVVTSACCIHGRTDRRVTLLDSPSASAASSAYWPTVVMDSKNGYTAAQCHSKCALSGGGGPGPRHKKQSQ